MYERRIKNMHELGHHEQIKSGHLNKQRHGARAGVPTVTP